MATRDVQAQAVKDVPAETFIKAYAAHLKSTDKVRRGAGGGSGPGRAAACLVPPQPAQQLDLVQEPCLAAAGGCQCRPGAQHAGGRAAPAPRGFAPAAGRPPGGAASRQQPPGAAAAARAAPPPRAGRGGDARAGRRAARRARRPSAPGARPPRRRAPPAPAPRPPPPPAHPRSCRSPTGSTS